MSGCPDKNGTEVSSILTCFDRNDHGTTGDIRNLQLAHIGIRSLCNELLDENPTDAVCKIIIDQTQNAYFVPKYYR
ncbi:hypothetical protein HNY73_013901 [Argiope bruennichi]|uniref:Uncharacterized protein n=1 Tax=Argiope bruennichi TaxID=94029 RepID=A0A8T0ESI3_ARGBR|nr:hypothetical protein HNY73_013901 [Argiope bruennichi]